MHNLLLVGKVKQSAVILLIQLIFIDLLYSTDTPSTGKYNTEQNR